MATRSSVYVDVNTLHVGIGTSAPSHQLHVRGDARITGTIYDVNNQHQWIPGSTIEWKPTTSPPALTLPTGGAFTSLTATALYRYFGTDISYSPTISGTITAQPTNTAQNFLLSVPYPANSNIYTTQTIVGELWLNVQSGLSSNTFKSYAQLIPGNYSNVTLRALTGTTDESLSTILAGSRITLQGNITYAAQYINNMNAIPSSYVPAIFAQDQVGKVALNTGGNPPRAQLDIITNSNTPTLVVDQQGTGNIAEFLDAGVQKVVIDANGNVGIGTTLPRNVFDMGYSTGAILLPSGTSAEQPTGVLGMLRFNLTTNRLQFYNSSGWNSIGGVSASGGTVTEVGGYRIHTFTSSSTFTVYSGGQADILMVAGGGGGGWDVGGGGGAGGLIWQTNMNITSGNLSVVVGGGGPGSTTGSVIGTAQNGQNTTFNGLTAIGGGGGGNYNGGNGATGGSGGGAAGYISPSQPGTGTAGQGNRGGYANSGNTTANTGGGGGGAGAVGSDSVQNGTGFAEGGIGLTYTISGSSVMYAKGGRGGGDYWTGGVVGSINTGNGGDGGGYTGTLNNGLAGGSGIVIIRYLV